MTSAKNYSRAKRSTQSARQTNGFFFFFSETGSFYAAHAGLELKILLPQPLKSWDYRHVPSHQSTNGF
jgi:hypothetical protein